MKWDFWLQCLSQPKTSLGGELLVDAMKNMRFTAKIVIHHNFIAVLYLYDLTIQVINPLSFTIVYHQNPTEVWK